MLVIGLSGGVASGKNFVADEFAKLGVPVFDADAAVHKIFENDQNTIKKISEIFENVIENNQINRHKLGELVLANREKLAVLENLIHPLVQAKELEFIDDMKLKGFQMVMLNIPLLFEKDGYKRCDKTILVTAPKIVQKYRFIKRAKQKKSPASIFSLAKKFEQIHQNQMPVEQKKQLADFIIFNGFSRNFTLKQIKKIYSNLAGK